jgi:putative acetyltransferase
MFRLARESDFPRLREIFRETVLKLAPSLYSAEQVTAWSLSPNNRERFWWFIFEADTYLLIENDVIIGFCGLQENGHIASLYVDADYTRQGYGTKLLLYVLKKGEKQGIKRFFTEASFFSQPVFLRCGFQVVTRETVNYNNVLFQRYKMEKII